VHLHLRQHAIGQAQQLPLQPTRRTRGLLPMRIHDHVRRFDPWAQPGKRGIDKIRALSTRDQYQLVTMRARQQSQNDGDIRDADFARQRCQPIPARTKRGHHAVPDWRLRIRQGAEDPETRGTAFDAGDPEFLARELSRDRVFVILSGHHGRARSGRF